MAKRGLRINPVRKGRALAPPPMKELMLSFLPSPA
jgi:hypothetical protein